MAKLSSDNKYVIVERGDTLSAIAKTYAKYTGGVSYKVLADRNDIDNPDRIYVGQEILLSDAVKKSSNNTSKATIKHFGLQSNTQNTIFATWTWSKSNTENYKVQWEYDTGDGVWFKTESTVDIKQSLYTIPGNAKRVRFTVKPISKKRTVNKKESSYWTAGWSTAKIYSLSDNPPDKPSVPTVSVDGLNFKASLENITGTASIIQFELYKDDVKNKSGKASIKAGGASFTFSVTAGSMYKVRCRAYGNGDYSSWTDYSSPIGTVPATPKGFTKCILQGDNKDQVYLEWNESKTATSYEIEYAKNQSYFDNTANQTTKVTIQSDTAGANPPTSFLFVDDFKIDSESETAGTWFFRLRAINDKGNSAWSTVSTTNIGSAPSAPTTWSSANNVAIGEPLRLYWVHNGEDGSAQSMAQIKLIVDGVADVIPKSFTEDDKDITSSYEIDTSKYLEGCKIDWQIQTLGAKEGSYSEWSVMRTVYIHAKPSVELSVTNLPSDNPDKEYLETLEQFPFYLEAITTPVTQVPVGFYISIVADDSYDTVDILGNDIKVSKGDVLYTKYVDDVLTLSEVFSADKVDLENNQSYTLRVSAYMNSGITAETSHQFEVAWSEIEDIGEPNAEISYDDETYVTYIRPYCEDVYGELIDGVTLSVYRREFDGSFTEIASGINNTDNTFVTDPHPALDFARYRIVATVLDTGAVTYCDLPGYPIGCKAVIIQWDEVWSSFDTVGNTEAVSDPTWTGSLLKLMYNIDISDKNKKDVEFVSYIGRKRPVAYYGTQLGESSTWKMEIPKDDKETLYALRRLAGWMGNVYVREPSGTGYWASVTVDIPQKHRDLTISITLDVTRVEGGI